MSSFTRYPTIMQDSAFQTRSLQQQTQPTPPMMPLRAAPSSSLSSLDSNDRITRSIHMPICGPPSSSMPQHKAPAPTMPMQAYQPPQQKGPAHWTTSSAERKVVASPVVVVPVVPVVPFQSSLGASLLAQKLQQASSPPLQAAAVAPAAPPTIDTHLPLPGLMRSDSVPSSSGSAVSFGAFGSQSGGGSLAPSPRRSTSSPLQSLVDTAPCPLSLWLGCEDAAHARCVLNAYATKLDLYTQRRSGCRAPLEFIGRVRRDRIDIQKLHHAVKQYNHNKAKAHHPRQRYASAAALTSSSSSSYSSLRQKNSRSSPCLSSVSPSSSPCFSSGLLSSPSPLAHLPALGSFATLDLVSIYSRDTLPLGQAFPLIRHEWMMSVWNVQDGVAESSVRIHTEYEEDEEEQAAGEEKRENDDEEDEEDSASKSMLQLFAKCVAKAPSSKKHSSNNRSPVMAPANTGAAAAAAAAAAGFNPANTPYALTASITSGPPVDWHPATLHQNDHHHHHHLNSATTTATSSSSSSNSSSRPRSQSSASGSSPSPSPPLQTSFLYCLPIFSEDVAAGSYDTFGCRLQRDTGLTLASLANKPRKAAASASSAAAAAAPSAACQAGSVATVGDHSLGYSGSQSGCILQCMRLLRPTTALAVGNGGDDSAGEAHCAQTVINHEMEMAALAAAMACMQQQQQQQSVDAAAGSGTAASTEDDSPSGSSDSSSSGSESEEDELSDIGEDISTSFGAGRGNGGSGNGGGPRSSTNNHNSAKSGFEFSDHDDDDDDQSQSDDDEAKDDSDDEEDESRRTRQVSASKAVAIGGGGKSSASSRVAHVLSHHSSEEESDEESDDDGAHTSASSFGGHSFSGSHAGSLCAGSLGDELQAQLAALGCGGKKAAPAASKIPPPKLKGRK